MNTQLPIKNFGEKLGETSKSEILRHILGVQERPKNVKNVEIGRGMSNERRPNLTYSILHNKRQAHTKEQRRQKKNRPTHQLQHAAVGSSFLLALLLG